MMKKTLIDKKQTDDSRRSFVMKTGAAVSAALATASAGAGEFATGHTRTLKEELERKTRQLGILEDINAIRALHHEYTEYANRHSNEDIVSLFSKDAEICFNGTVIRDKNRDIRRLYRDGTALRSLPVPGQDDDITIAPDRRSASATFQGVIEIVEKMTGPFSMVEIAHMQGQGRVNMSEQGVIDTEYKKEGDIWKINKLSFRPIQQA